MELSIHYPPLSSSQKIVSMTISNFSMVFILFFLHAFLAIFVRFFPTLSTLHAIIVIGVSFAWALIGNKNVPYITAYIIGAELFWRMTGANVFWETGKYAIAFTFTFAILRHRSIKIPPFIFLFFLALLPGFLGVNNNLPLSRLRDVISFYGSGHIALFICATYFFSIRLQELDITKIYLMIVLPLISIATYALFNIILSPQITWTNEANFAGSGGFGPNQISTALGLGGLLIIQILLSTKITPIARVGLATLAIWLLTQNLLTFSRGGFYTAILSLGIFAIQLFKGYPKRLVSFLGAIIIFSSLFLYLIIPQLDNFTNNQLSKRFQETNPTGRDKLAVTELKAFWEHPEGVGVGKLNELRGSALHLGGVASHNEFTRLLAEHGILGLLALVFLAIALLFNYIRFAQYPLHQALIGSLIVWSLFTLGHSAFRITAPAYLIGLSFLSLDKAHSASENSVQ